MEGSPHPGIVGFYSLGGNSRIRLHNGVSNQRLKCQLVVEAPNRASGTTDYAWVEVGGETRQVKTGDVLGLDDSYLRRFVNQGDSSRLVVLDVTFLHPALLPQAAASDEL